MPIDTTDPLSDGWWLERLAQRLAVQAEHCAFLDRYYSNDVLALVPSSKAVREAYQRLMQMARTNFAELVVEAVRERMNPTGFRTGAVGDELGDGEAWRIWQANALDADSALVHRASLAMGVGYVIVGPRDESINAPLITPEDPRQVVTEQDPSHKRRTVAALKMFRDDARGVDVAYLYLPGRVRRAARQITNQQLLSTDQVDLSGWEWQDDGVDLPAGAREVVPVVRFANRADLAGGAKAEFEPHLSILDRINYTILNRLEIATMQAFKQRGIKGVPNVDAQGQPINYNDIFSSDPGALWLLPESAEIWESGAVDLTPIRSAIRDDVQDLAAVTRTPLFYLTPEATNGSAEGASLAREGLVFKTSDRLVQAGESWEQVMSLAFLFAGDEKRASRADMEVIWASPERFSLAERYDAAAKAQAAGVPWRTVMSEILQFSPQQIARMDAERASDELRAAAFAGQMASAPTVESGASLTATPVGVGA